MTFALLSDYSCVESGSVYGMVLQLYAGLADATKAYDQLREQRSLELRAEIKTIRTTPGMVFDAPYIVWFLLLDLTDIAGDAPELDATLATLVNQPDDGLAAISPRVVRVEGWVIEDHGSRPYLLPEILEDLAMCFEDQ